MVVGSSGVGIALVALGMVRVDGGARVRVGLVVISSVV